MENDINKKITIEVEVNPDGQQQINQYKTALDNLRSSISNLSNPLSSLSNNISSLDKGVIKANASLDKINKQNKETESSGNKVKESVKNWIETFESLRGVIRFVKLSFVSLEEAMTGGIAAIIAYLPEITNWISSLVKGKEAVDQAKLSVDTMTGAIESSDYSNAVQQVNELKINVGLAKQGFLDKKEVLQEYI